MANGSLQETSVMNFSKILSCKRILIVHIKKLLNLSVFILSLFNSFPIYPENTHLQHLQLQFLPRANSDYSPNRTPKFAMGYLTFIIIFISL